MATSILRPNVRMVASVTLGAAAAYTGYRYSNSSRMLHAESPPSDARATLKKIPFGSFTELKLESAEMVNHNVKKLRFALPDADSISDLKPVSSLLSQQYVNGSWFPTMRPYTPISGNDEPGHVTFLVKKYPNGKSSGNLHSLKPGDSIKFKALHELDYKPNQHQSILVIAGGSGITPIYQLTNAILKNPADQTRITLIYANNSPEDILLKSELEALEKQYPNRFKKLFTVSRTTPGSEGSYEQGYVTKELIEKVWPAKTQGQKVLVSGPPAMTESIAGAKGGFGWTQGSVGGILKDLGYGQEQVHKF